ncbi:hypothetical protein cypCar_00022057 [Cyprinus carpio]|nr:hypothetical protein cypCar_00022057 [Cyprinus carpio]
MELKWNDAPVTGPLEFSRDVFDKFTLAPTVKELFALLHSSDSKSEDTGEKKPDGSSSEAKAVKCNEDSDVSNILASDEPSSECKQTKAKPVKRTATPAFPEPLVPYPCTSTLNAKNRKLYLNMLVRKNYSRASKCLMEQVKNEVTEFMKYLQDVSRACADGYNYMPPGSACYTEEYFAACVEHMKSYPQVYSIQEITSLTSAKFVGEISLIFEKQLLAMGKIDMLDTKVIAENTQLAVDYETVSNVIPPAKKATLGHTAISNDSNAEKLCATYEPQDKMSRSVFAIDDAGMDFGTDLTDLESFGESYKPSKKVKEQTEPKTASTNPTATPSQLTPSPQNPTDSSGTTKHTSASQDAPTETFELTVAKVQAETDPLADGENAMLNESDISEKESVIEDSKEKIETPSAQCPPTKRPRHEMKDKIDQDLDSDEERLVIDDISSPQRPQTQVTPAEVSSPQAPDPVTPGHTNPLGKGTKKGIKRPRISGECDQLGQILRMQDAMLKSTPSKNQEPVKPHVPEDKPPEAKTHSLVKQCVTSYLESREGQGEDITLPADVPVLLATQRKRLLKEDLQVSAEDEMDYDPPAEGSILYKLYSLLDVLLMVRSSVTIAHPRHDKDTFRAVPVHVLPKLEYQLCYGAENLTHTEVCQLWAEKLLHSSTVSFISRINAHTSEVAQMQNLPDDWIQNVTCDFKQTRCLNTLYHLLKKVSLLQEGRYFLVHKPREGFVTIFKASDETKSARSVYHLQNAHCGPPAVTPGIPWVPLDPSHVLPFHQKHSRPPCTFPPRPPPQPKGGTGPKQRQGKNAVRPPQAANQKQSTKKKRKKDTRNKHKQAWMDNMRVKLMKDMQKTQTSEGGKDGKP